MKTRLSLLTLLASGLAAGNALGATAATPDMSAVAAPKLTSEFILPANVKQGRDPFFPESNRVFEAQMNANQAKQAAPTVEISSLKVYGISGTPDHLLAIINNHSFAAGDEGEVLTTAGRISLRCVSVTPSRVTVIVNGQYHQLNVELAQPK